ncbi:hypothetical protein Ahy_A01g000118 [Arachis hypogaea]|uniref:Replication factor A C-terminal domain-containing protein n=1 Tax=Arachis hypogaea TaxID=3818 RepID=A0A445EJB1_ARAHY|nr:hypothetical protein Ahy_A01g000118 [Arachis hypogaea]
MVLQDEQGDRIHATICKHGLDLFRERIKEHAMYNMPNFIVKINNEKVRITAHKYKLSFYTKTDVEVLPIETFLLTHSKCAHLLNLRQMLQWMKICCLETSYWIVGNIVSLKVGKYDWSYTPCKTCPKKVLESKNRYWCDHCRRVGFKATLRYKLQVIVTNESGCMKLLLWNKEAEHMVGKTAEIIKELCVSLIHGSLKYFASVIYVFRTDKKNYYVHVKKWKKGESYPKYMDNIVDKRFLFKLNITYKNINVVEGVYSVLKISDDEYLMSCFGYANSSFDASCSQHVPNTSTTEIGDNSNGHGPVSLSKDLAVEGNGDSSSETPAKRSSPDTGDGSTAEALTRILRGIVEKNLD